MNKRPVIVAVIGYQNAGKTGLVEALVREASEQNLTVAHLKHDGHADDVAMPDWEKPSSDTVRVAEAGARFTMVASKQGWLVHDWGDGQGAVDGWLNTLTGIIEMCGADVDLILVEGAKFSTLPKLVVLRSVSDWSALVKTGVTNIGAVCVTEIESSEADYPGGESLPVPLFRAHDVRGILTHLLDPA